MGIRTCPVGICICLAKCLTQCLSNDVRWEWWTDGFRGPPIGTCILGVQWSRDQWRHVTLCLSLCQQPCEIDGRFKLTTYGKPHIECLIVTWLMAPRDSKRLRSWSCRAYIWSSISQQLCEIDISSNWPPIRNHILRVQWSCGRCCHCVLKRWRSWPISLKLNIPKTLWDRWLVMVQIDHL